MNIIDAEKEARREAISNKIDMVVTYNPYDEAEDEKDRFGYMAECMFKTVSNSERIIITIRRNGYSVRQIPDNF